MFCARVYKSHFAQAKDIERFLQDQPDFLETGNGGRPALKEAKMNDDSTNQLFFFRSIYTPKKLRWTPQIPIVERQFLFQTIIF